MPIHGLRVALVVLALSCEKPRATNAPDDSEPQRAPATAPTAGRAPSAAPAATARKQTSRVPAEARQLVKVTSASWQAPRGSLSRHTRSDPDATWTPVGEVVEVTLGRAGLGWGRGLHGAGAPPGKSGPLKREGDKRAPAGLFRLGGSFGYAAAPPAGTRLPYTRSTQDWRCVDDGDSRHYNQLLAQSTVAENERDWRSAEMLLRADGRYTWLVVVEHNQPSPVAGGGSCIFLHVWHQRQPTIGCTALEEGNLVTLLTWLEPGALYAAAPEAEIAEILQ